MLASSVDDTISVLRNFLVPAIQKLIQNEPIDTRENEVQSADQLDNLFRSMLNTSEDIHSSTVSSTQAHVTAFHDRIRESLSNVVSNKLMNAMKGQVQLEDKAKLVTAMKGVRNSIPSAALTKLNNDWLTVTSTIRNSVGDQIKSVILNFKSILLSSLGKINSRVGSSDSSLSDYVESFSTSVSFVIESLSENTASLLPEYTALAIDKLTLTQSLSLQDDDLSLYIVEGKTQKFRTEKRKECGGGGLFGWGRTCVKFTEAIPYDQAVFSPDFSAFESAFDDTISNWMGLYDKQVKDYINDISISSGIAAKNKLNDVLRDPQQKVFELLQSRQIALNKTKQNISFLEKKQDEVNMLLNELRKSMM